MTNIKSRGPAVLALLTAAALTLSACDGGASAVRTVSSDSGGKAYASGASGQGGGFGGASGVDHRKDPTPLLDGKPMWAANRQHSAEDNARFHFKRDGQAFGADTTEDYVRTAQAFIAAPPAGSEIIKRSNGDRLIYDPRGNVFAVATADGAPRALFKPKDGAAYWAKQKANTDTPFKGGRRKASSGSSDSEDDRQG
jgi:hypothetical protein